MLKERRVQPFFMWGRVMLFKEGKRVKGEKRASLFLFAPPEVICF
jgi:hypothetical protein